MNYNSYKETYAEAKRTRKSSPEAIHMCVMKPALMRRLVTLDEQLVETKKLLPNI